MPEGSSPYSLGISTTGQCLAMLSACLRNLEVLIKLKVASESSLM